MATSILDLLLQLDVKGQEQAVKLENTIKELERHFKKLADAGDPLDKMIGEKPRQDVLKVIDAVSQLYNKLAKPPVDVDLSKPYVKASDTIDVLIARLAVLIQDTERLGPASAQTAKYTAEMERLKEASAKAQERLHEVAERLKEARFAQNAAEEAKLVAQMEKLAIESSVAADKITTLERRIMAVVQSGKLPLGFKFNQMSREAGDASTQIAFLTRELTRAQNAIKGVGQGSSLGQLRAELNAATTATSGLAAKFGETSREFLFFRRLLLASGLVGLSKQALDVVISFDQIHQALKAVFGTTEAADKEFKFLQATAERLGLSLTSISDRYSKLAIAGREAGLSAELVKDNFLAVAEAGAQLHLSTEQVDGALLALEQIASKGKVSLEELRRQLGNALPGAVTIAAKSLGITTAQLFQLVESGQLASDVFLKVFPTALRASFGVDSSTRIETTQAALNRFKNSLQAFTDAVVRAGVLDLFINSLTSLTKSLSDPEVISGVKSFAKGVGDFGQAVKDNIEPLKTLVLGIVAFKVAMLGLSVIKATSVTMAEYAASLTAARNAAAGLATANTAVAATSGAVAATGAAAASAAPVMAKLFGSIKNIAALAFNPITIAVTVLGIAGIEAIEEARKRYEEGLLKLQEQERQYASNDKMARHWSEQVTALQEFANVTVLTTQQIKNLTEQQAKDYAKQLEGAKALQEFEGKRLQAVLANMATQIKALKERSDLDENQALNLARLQVAYKQLSEQQANTGVKAELYKGTLEQLAKATGLSVLSLEKLSGTQRSSISAFDKSIEAGESLHKTLEKLIPDNFSEGSSKAIGDVANSLLVLNATGRATAKVIEDEIGKKLDRLTGTELAEFATNARKAFRNGETSAEGMALVLTGVVSAAVKNLGIDVDTTGDRVSKKFAEMTRSLVLIGENGRDAGAKVKAGLEQQISTAKTRDELLFLKKSMEDAGLAGRRFGTLLVDSFQRLEDKLLETKGVFDNSLGDSFKRFGAQSSENIKALADLAIIDFKRIEATGNETARNLLDIFIKAFGAQELGKAFEDLGIKTDKVLFGMLDRARDSFAQVAKSGTATADGLITAFEAVRNASIAAGLGTRGLTADSKALEEALKKLYREGKINAEEYQDAVFQAGLKTKEFANQTGGGLAAAMQLFGIQTRQSLEDAAFAARDAFDLILSSGKFTLDELDKARAIFQEKWEKAFGAMGRVAQELFMVENPNRVFTTGGIQVPSYWGQTLPGQVRTVPVTQKDSNGQIVYNFNIGTDWSGGGKSLADMIRTQVLPIIQASQQRQR